MTTADRWTRAVREQLGLGRLLPLGGPGDGAWIAERAAREVLLAAARGVAGVRPGDLRVGLADPDDVREPAVPLPPGALPPGPLRVTADFAVVVGPTTAVAEPLPATAARLRAALAEAAAARLGLTAADVDLRVTGLLDETPEAGPEAGPGPGPVDAADTDTVDGDGDGDGGSEASGDEGRAARAALTVPGVARLTGVLGRPVHLTEPPPQEGALPRRHVRVELAVRADHRAVEVARRVRAAVSEAVADRPTVAVVVTRTDVG
ncbi:nucleopolyhedrovirus P10 family protein [Streptomyces sp. ME01-18h]|uniref:nucleopolyhedrovirus P10 family protein n=1 Tax=Streptomyces sp. ME01-18h TaxID=462920 RepID=UPI0029B5B79F|nr:nucleopolyhedrovirus P10 family protein [Streptomyces sp. ME01-18h]MDX3401228.1 nucleopolyhedrovirus P10 family protein [Streptomyces sp. ME01-18h]